MNEIAAQGGSGKAIVLDPSAPLRAQMVAAIDTVVDQIAPPVCSYRPGPVLHPGQAVEFDYTDSSGFHVVDEVSKGTCDPNTGGWYFDDPKNPTTIDLCPSSCKAVNAAEGGVSLRLGCTGSPGPVPN